MCEEEDISKIQNQFASLSISSSPSNNNGSEFEKEVDFEKICIKRNYLKCILANKSKYGFYYEIEDIVDSVKIHFLKQSGLNFYLKSKFNIESIPRRPDQCFLIHRKNGLKPLLVVIECKYQATQGSVIDKFYAVNGYLWQYRKYLDSIFDVCYIFVVSEFLHTLITKKTNKSSVDLKEYLWSQNVKVLKQSSLYFNELEELIKGFC